MHFLQFLGLHEFAHLGNVFLDFLLVEDLLGVQLSELHELYFAGVGIDFLEDEFVFDLPGEGHPKCEDVGTEQGLYVADFPTVEGVNVLDV